MNKLVLAVFTSAVLSAMSLNAIAAEKMGQTKAEYNAAKSPGRCELQHLALKLQRFFRERSRYLCAKS